MNTHTYSPASLFGGLTYEKMWAVFMSGWRAAWDWAAPIHSRGKKTVQLCDEAQKESAYWEWELSFAEGKTMTTPHAHLHFSTQELSPRNRYLRMIMIHTLWMSVYERLYLQAYVRESCCRDFATAWTIEVVPAPRPTRHKAGTANTKFNLSALIWHTDTWPIYFDWPISAYDIPQTVQNKTSNTKISIVVENDIYSRKGDKKSPLFIKAIHQYL